MLSRVPTSASLIGADLDTWSVTTGGEVVDGEGSKMTLNELTTAVQELEARVAEIKAFHARVVRMAEAGKSQSG